ncbi:hypothetical protein A9975_02010 [Cupriavidus sp. UME77]|nr:hypothetical protein [Cupriavidus sp. UME77]
MVRSCFLRIRTICLVLTVLVDGLVPVAHAAAPQARTQASGFYRMMLGDFETPFRGWATSSRFPLADRFHTK